MFPNCCEDTTNRSAGAAENGMARKRKSPSTRRPARSPRRPATWRSFEEVTATVDALRAFSSSAAGAAPIYRIPHGTQKKAFVIGGRYARPILMAPTVPAAADLPSALVETDQWVCWRTQERNGTETKIPINPHTGGFGSTTDPESWAAFETAREYAVDSTVDGVGFVFTDGDPFVGVDLDDCRVPETGTLTDEATAIVETLASYTEVSPSGTGVHVLVKGTLPGERNRAGDVELYETARFFTVTGDHVDGTPLTVEARGDAVRRVYAEHVRPDKVSEAAAATAADAPPAADTAAPEHRPAQEADTEAADDSPPGSTMGMHHVGGAASTGEPTDGDDGAGACTDADVTDAAALSDEELLDRARSAANGAKFQRLWRGETSGYESHSEADMALCSLLAFWSGNDPAQIDRLFRESGLMRDKWDERHFADGSTYGEKTIERVIAGTDEVYEPWSKEASATPSGSSASARESPAAADATSAAVAQLRQRVAELEARDEERLSVIADLRAQVERLNAENERLRAELEARGTDDTADAEEPSQSGSRLRRWLGLGS